MEHPPIDAARFLDELLGFGIPHEKVLTASDSSSVSSANEDNATAAVSVDSPCPSETNVSYDDSDEASTESISELNLSSATLPLIDVPGTKSEVSDRSFSSVWAVFLVALLAALATFFIKYGE